MLLVGEVQDIIIHSGVNRATVILHPDAIYKGHRVNNNVFRLAIPNAENLEDKVNLLKSQVASFQPFNVLEILAEKVGMQIQ